MSDEQTVQINVSDPESLGHGIAILNENIVQLGRSMYAIATVLGVSVAIAERSENHALTISQVLLTAIDEAAEYGLLKSPVLGTLRNAIVSGSSVPPPDDGSKLTLVVSDRKVA